MGKIDSVSFELEPPLRRTVDFFKKFNSNFWAILQLSTVMIIQLWVDSASFNFTAPLAQCRCSVDSAQNWQCDSLPYFYGAWLQLQNIPDFTGNNFICAESKKIKQLALDVCIYFGTFLPVLKTFCTTSPWHTNTIRQDFALIDQLWHPNICQYLSIFIFLFLFLFIRG